jgi:hypothetical protein
METNKIYKKYTIIVIFLLVYLVLIVALIWWLFKDANARGNLDKLESPAIIVLAIVISVLTFTVSSAVFSAIGKSKDNQALGMPEGSVRALIALSLITLFFILATQIYLKTSQGVVAPLSHMSEDQLKDMSAKDFLSKIKVDSMKASYDTTKQKTLYAYYYDVNVKQAINPEASDIAKTIIASFISLIAAISGFYFGSASAKSASSSSGSDAPAGKITPKTAIPTTGKKGQQMTFEWEVTPHGQPITVEVTGDSARPAADAANPLKYTYTPNTAATITLKVFLTNFPAISQVYSIVVSEP